MTRVVFLLSYLLAASTPCLAQTVTLVNSDAQRPQDVCVESPAASAGATLPKVEESVLAVYEVRAAERLEQNLLKVDGINVDRDVLVIICSGALRNLVQQSGSVRVEVRAWHKPRDAGWREIRLNEPSRAQVQEYEEAGATESNWLIQERVAVISAATVVNPIITIPLRREGVKEDDLVRLRVRIAPPPPKGATPPAPAPARPDAPQGTASPSSPPKDLPIAVPAPENEQILDTTFKVGRFGLHATFADIVVFVQRLGEDRANANGTNAVIFDQVNFRPTPGISYGFNYYHRRHALFRFLEPGFGMHLVFLNWNERVRNSTTSDADATQTTNLQIGIGGMVSMFDGTVVAVSGWNLQVKDQRPYFGVGFSITGLARKISQGLR